MTATQRPITAAQRAAFKRCVRSGGVAIFPTDTLYGLGCDPRSGVAVARMYALKGRPRHKPSAVMFFALGDALAALEEVGPRARAVVAALLPGPVTVVVANPAGRFGLAGGEGTLGVRVPRLEGPAAALGKARVAVLQTSANQAGGPDPRSLSEVPRSLLSDADLVLDAGPLAGAPSTVVDLTRYEETGEWSVVRAGALGRDAVEAAIEASSAGR